jgi:hypothetical protein
MKEISVVEKLKDDVRHYLPGVTIETTGESYDGLVQILLKYKGQISEKEINSVFISIIIENNLSNIQEDVLLDASNRLFGFCEPSRRIDW